MAEFKNPSEASEPKINIGLFAINPKFVWAVYHIATPEDGWIEIITLGKHSFTSELEPNEKLVEILEEFKTANPKILIITKDFR